MQTDQHDARVSAWQTTAERHMEML